jgi:hypothetical protein
MLDIGARKVLHRCMIPGEVVTLMRLLLDSTQRRSYSTAAQRQLLKPFKFATHLCLCKCRGDSRFCCSPAHPLGSRAKTQKLAGPAHSIANCPPPLHHPHTRSIKICLLTQQAGRHANGWLTCKRLHFTGPSWWAAAWKGRWMQSSSLTSCRS